MTGVFRRRRRHVKRRPFVSPKETVQYGRPISDISSGNWTPSTGIDLYAVLDEVRPDNSDYVSSGLNPSSDTFEVKLTSLTDPAVSSKYYVRYRYKKQGSGTLNLTCYLMEGATQRDTWSHNDIGTFFEQYQRTFSQAVIDSIVDHTNLRVRITANVV